MAVAISTLTPTQLRAPANPLAVAGNAVFVKQCTVTVPASTTAETMDTGMYVEPGTLVIGAVLDTDTTYGATATLSLKSKTAGVVFVAAKTLTVVGGEQCTIAANKGVVCPSSATANDQIQLLLAAADSPASETNITITLVCVSIRDMADASVYQTQNT